MRVKDLTQEQRQLIARRGYQLAVVEGYDYERYPWPGPERMKNATHAVHAVKRLLHWRGSPHQHPRDSACATRSQDCGYRLEDKPKAPVCEHCLWRIAYDAKLPLHARLTSQREGGSTYCEDLLRRRFAGH